MTAMNARRPVRPRRIGSTLKDRAPSHSAPYADAPSPGEIMDRLRAGEAVTLEQACRAAAALGLRIELPPAEQVAATPGRVVCGWMMSNYETLA